MIIKKRFISAFAFLLALAGYGILLDKHLVESQNLRRPSINEFEESCALLFFGLPKHFKDISLPSIRKYILNVNPGCDVFAHTYDIKTTTNARNGEDTSPVHPEDVFLLTASTAMDTVENFLLAHNVSYYRSVFPPDEPWTYPTSMDNMIKQWHSIDGAWRMMEERGKEYKRVGLFRLDALYTHEISIAAKEGGAVIPNFLKSGGMNDRMFFGDVEYARVWATGRFDDVPPFLASQSKDSYIGLHSEKFMKFLMRNIPVAEKSICFHRVRATGKILKDCSLGILDDLKIFVFGFREHYSRR
eukprot:CAMPEP_0118636516 /NCGR_PEP_ID=MMETSP0785-20121206/2669_1 /TAXON_ID=91992 /ORGANISM="Bolidomonas pacifica, Strain CCMP 1866" /LENGTH=300 /DNA_ID=CAMNT_0006527657 /DNA_START=238 /DNA_END=1136 /DNA_ORIENTATION=+